MNKETNLTPWEEFIKERRTIPTNAEPTVIACPECGKMIYRRTDIVLASYPPKHSYFCECGWTGCA